MEFQSAIPLAVMALMFSGVASLEEETAALRDVAPPHTRAPFSKTPNFREVGEHTPHLRESVRKPALTSFSSAPVRPARAPMVCT